jgi:predicted ATP-grasp superfamily ATP-dependent carboligase
VTPTAELEKTKKQALTTSKPLLQQALSVIITDAQTYQQADTLRSKIKDAHKTFWDRVQRIVTPAKEAYDEAISMRHELCDSLEDAQKHITAKMKSYQLGEAEKERKAQLERERLDREAEAKRKAAEAARTPAMQIRLEKQAEEIEEKSEAKVYKPVQGAASGTRTVEKWRVTDLKALLKGIIAGDVPEDVIEIRPAIINTYIRHGKEEVKAWSGLEFYNDVEIVSKR